MGYRTKGERALEDYPRNESGLHGIDESLLISAIQPFQ
jgi:hypothetical protein